MRKRGLVRGAGWWLVWLLVPALLPLLAVGADPAVADNALARGRLALADGFYKLAEEAFREVLAREDVQPEAADYILQSHYEQKRFDLLSADLERFTAEKVLDPAAGICWRALLRESAADPAGALKELSWFETEEGRRSVHALRGLRLKALAHIKAGEMARAAAVFEQLDRVYTNAPGRVFNRMDWGLVLLAAGEPGPAQAVWAPLVAGTNVPAGLAADARYWSAQGHLLTGAVTVAESLLQPLATGVDVEEMRRVQSVFALAKIRRLASDAAGGTMLLTNAMAVIRNPELRKQAGHELACHLLDAGQLEAAALQVKAFTDAYAADPAAAGLLRRLGDAYLGASRYADADGVFRQVLESFGDAGGSASRGLALALTGMGRDAEAALVFERAAASPSADPELAADSLFRAGDRYLAARQFRKALDAYDRFLGGGESRVRRELASRAIFQRGATLAAMNETAAAVEAFETLARTYPQSQEAADALLGIGELHLSQERYEPAAAAFARVMDAYPGGAVYWRALHGRGMARYHLWEPRAVEDFERVAAAPAAEAAMVEHSRFMQAMCLYRLGRDAEALQLCRDFRQRYPSSAWAPPAHFWIARFEYNTGNTAVAEAEFLSFVETYPAHELAAQGLLRAGLCASRRQQYLLAIEQFGRMARLYPQSELLAEARFHQAEAMVQLGRYATAILGYEEVIKSAGDREMAGMAWGRKGDCQFTLGAEEPARYEEAVQSYLAVLKIPGLRLEFAMQAAYKLGLTYEKLGRAEEALELYYGRVMMPFLLERENGKLPVEAARIWFSRAARGAADIVEARKDWRRLVRILERAASADVEFSAEAKSRIQAVKSDYWWMFY